MHLGKHTNACMHTRTHTRAHTQEESEIQIFPGFGTEFLGSICTSPPSMGPSGLPQPEVHFPLLHLHSVLFLTFSDAQPILSSRYGLSMQNFSLKSANSAHSGTAWEIFLCLHHTGLMPCKTDKD